jgi:hypothetical protein
MMPLFAGIGFLAIFAVASPGLPPTYLLMQAQERPSKRVQTGTQTWTPEEALWSLQQTLAGKNIQ